MMRRTQIYLTEEEHRILDRESRRRGVSKAALIREAVGRTYGPQERRDVEVFRRALDASSGTWSDIPDDELELLARLRGGGSDRERELFGRQAT